MDAWGILNHVPDLSTPIINDDADRILGRIILRYGMVTFGLLVLATFGMSIVNIDVKQNHLFRYHKPLDILSILIVLIPFFIGINRLFAARMKMGRDFIAQRRWREAVATLDPFAGVGQRFLDSSGEAHYMLAQAYASTGQSAKADTMREFVLRHRNGVWADKIKSAPARPSVKAARTAQEKISRPANRKPRRRF